MPAKRAPKTLHTIYDFIGTILVVCPRCSNMATVASDRVLPAVPVYARMICTRCGLAKSQGVDAYSLGSTTDPYFGHSLWLQAPCSRHILWAYNRAHLEFLKQFVGATDRRRPIRESAEPLNTLLVSRLPRWMQSSKNRDEIVKTIAVMEAKLAKAG
jgi:hypothetical protein